MKLIDAEQIRELVAPIAPMLVGHDVHYERIAFMDEIDQLPKIEAKPVVHAHWKLDPNGMDFGLSAWRCSNCGGQNTMIPPFIPTKYGGYVPKNPNAFAGSKYCPNCGAIMDEEE